MKNNNEKLKNIFIKKLETIVKKINHFYALVLIQTLIKFLQNLSINLNLIKH